MRRRSLDGWGAPLKPSRFNLTIINIIITLTSSLVRPNSGVPGNREESNNFLLEFIPQYTHARRLHPVS